MIHRLSCVVLSLALAAPAGALAQNYPTKPVRVLVGLAAGGGTDLIARIVVPRVSEALGQPFIIENRVGAAGMIAAEAVKNATPDGYTLLFSPNGVFVINPTIYKKISYSPTKDFIPLSQSVTFPLIVSVNANVPAKTVRELVEFLKKNAGKNNCGGSGGTFELAVRLLTSKTGTDCTFVQYKGNNDTAQALMTGDLHFALVDTGPIFPAIQGGKVRGLAVTTTQRDATFPDMPTVKEAGFPDLEMTFWMGLFAPSGTPAAIVKRLEGEAVRVVKQPEVVKQIHNRQANPSGLGSQEFARLIENETQKWDAVRKQANIPQLD